MVTNYRNKNNNLVSFDRNIVPDYYFQKDNNIQLRYFKKFNFNHPLYILYSSGTTGVPKCIVHSSGGALIQHKKEHILHCDINEKDRVCISGQS